MLRTVLSCPIPAGRKEWGLLAGSVWQATGDGLSGGTSRPQKCVLYFTCKWSQKISLCPWTELCKNSEKPRRTLSEADMCELRNTEKYGHVDRQNNSGVFNTDHRRVLIKGLRHQFEFFWRAPWLGNTNWYFWYWKNMKLKYLKRRCYRQFLTGA